MKRGLAKLLILELSIAFILLTGFALRTAAQTDPTAGLLNDLLSGFNVPEQVTLNYSPVNPAPGADINLSVEAYGTDLNKANIVWTVNGAIRSSGIGVKNFTTKAGNYGQNLNIQARIQTVTGQTVIKSISISAQDVDILWEANSYTHPFYKGRALYGQEGSVTFVAMPNIINKSGARVNPSTLVYKWIVDERVVGNKSGYGINTFEYTGSILGNDNIVEVEVTAPDGTVGRSAVLLSTIEPRTVLYENNPLYGLLTNAAVVDGFQLKDRDIRVEALPYFFSANSKVANNLNYSWFINDSRLPIDPLKNSAIFRNTNNESGETRVSVTTENRVQTFQRDNASALIQF
jgi:hypothetical protein